MKWKSVDIGLPEPNVPVLLTNGSIAVVSKWLTEFARFERVDVTFWDHPETHWMPLPELPTGISGDE